MPIIAAASSRLKQQLARDIAAKAQQQLVDGQDDAASCRSAVQLHARAVVLTREAAVDAQQAGAVLLHVAAQQQVARLLTSQPGSVLPPQQSTSRQGLSAALVQEKATALEALACLQVGCVGSKHYCQAGTCWCAGNAHGAYVLSFTAHLMWSSTASCMRPPSGPLLHCQCQPQ